MRPTQSLDLILESLWCEGTALITAPLSRPSLCMYSELVFICIWKYLKDWYDNIRQIWGQSRTFHAAGTPPVDTSGHKSLPKWKWDQISSAALKEQVEHIGSRGFLCSPDAHSQHCAKAEPQSRTSLFFLPVLFRLTCLYHFAVPSQHSMITRFTAHEVHCIYWEAVPLEADKPAVCLNTRQTEPLVLLCSILSSETSKGCMSQRLCKVRLTRKKVLQCL